MQDTTAGIALGVDACPLLLTVDEENPVEYAADDLRSMEMWTLVPLYRVCHPVALLTKSRPPMAPLQPSPASNSLLVACEILSNW